MTMIHQALDEYAKTLDRKFKHDRTKTVGASEIGQCARKISWLKARKKFDDTNGRDNWGARIRGKIMEEKFWYPALKKKFGAHLRNAGPAQVSVADEYLSATPDGIVCKLKKDALRGSGVKDIGGDCILVECKSIDPRVNMKKEKAEHEYQVQVQLGLVRKKTRHKPLYALVSYMDASFWNEVLEFPIKFKPETFDAAHARAKEIITSKGEDLQPEGWIAGGNECQWCPFTKSCGVARRGVPENGSEADAQLKAEITDMCREYLELVSMLSSQESDVRQMQQRIKDRLREKGINRIQDVVSWSMVKGRQSYDYPKMKEAAIAAGVDVEAFSTVGELSDRLQVSPKVAAAIPGA